MREAREAIDARKRWAVCVVVLILSCIAALASTAASGPQHEYVFQSVWGSYGSQLGEFRTPAGLAVGSDGSIYVADSGNNRIQKFSPDGTPLVSWGGLGSVLGRLNRPWGIAFANNRVYVVDRDNRRIQVFDPEGVFITAWETNDSLPAGIAVHQSLVYVTDSAHHRVLVYTLAGAFVRQWGGYGGFFGQFFSPAGVAVAADGSIYVADSGNHRIQRFSSDGRFLSAFGSYGQRCWQFDTPSFIWALPDGRLLVTDQAMNRVQEFSADGGCITWWGRSGSGDGQLRSPLGIVSDSKGRVYVADASNHRLQTFVYRELAVVPRVYLPLVLKTTRPLFEVRVNAGNNSYVDDQGRIWLNDQEYRPGGWGFIEKASSIYTTTETIAGTADQPLYQSERYSMAGYAFDVPIGFYEVTLKFAEIFYDRSGQRIFSVVVEGVYLITDLDIYAEVGRYRAYDRVFYLPVTDGQLNIDFVPKRFNDAPKISAIAVRQLSESTTVTPTPTPSSEHTVTFVQGVGGYRGTRDTYIDFYAPDANMEGQQSLSIRPYREDQGRASLLYFDVSSIPVNATVLTATLAVHVNYQSNPNALYVGAYRLLRPWNVTETTWISATQQITWAEPGANGDSDRSPVAEDAMAIDTVNAWYTFTLGSLVQAWVAQPQTNYGLILQGSPGGAVEYKIGASESWRAEHRPRLTVVYSTQPQAPTSTATPTPTPTPPATATPTPTPSVTVVVLQQGRAGYSGAQDTYITSWIPTANYSSALALYVRSNDLLAILLRFDVSSIPQDAEIEEATLSLWSYNSTNPNLLVADVFAIRRPWVVTETTWLSATQTIGWDVPGCNGIGTDRDGTVVDAGGFDSYNHWYTFTITSLVEGWIRDAETNHGLIVKGRAGSAVQYSIWSSEAPSADLRPFLMITYRRPGG